MNKKRKLTMPETDTTLSKAADDFVDSCEGLAKAKNAKDTAEQTLLDEMNKAKISAINHSGYQITVRHGRTTRDRINLK